MSSGLAIFLAVFGGLLITSAYLDRMAARTRVPGVLLVLVLGLLTDNNLSALPGESPPLLDLGRADQLAQVAVAVVGGSPPIGKPCVPWCALASGWPPWDPCSRL